MTNSDRFVVEEIPSPEIEQQNAESHWGNADINYYKRIRPWSSYMAEKILEFHPESVFEFGCNVGKNLRAIENVDKNLFVSGIDINKKAVEYGRRENNLRIALGDQHVMDVFPDECFDVSFTVSVIDHLATPIPALKSLCRISSKAVLLLEPWLGKEGKVVKNMGQEGKLVDTTPYSYSWDYPKMISDHFSEWKLTDTPYPMTSNLGPYYRLYTLVR